MEKEKNCFATSFRRIVNATKYSWQGMLSAWKGEWAFRKESICFLFMVPVGWWIGKTFVEKALLIGCGLIVLITELLNSAIEAIVDRFGEDHHELAGKAKDMGSAAVFISICLTVLIWALIIYDRFYP